MKSRTSSVHLQTAIILEIVLLGFLGSCLFHALLGHLGYPYNTFLFQSRDRFSDFFLQFKIASHANPYFETKGYESIYPPFAYLLLGFVRNTSPESAFVIFFLASYSLICATFLVTAYRDPRLSHVGATIALFSFSYPIIFTVDRGNIELATLAFLLLFINLYLNKQYLLSTPFLALAIAMKLYPVVFVALYFYRRETRRYALICLTVCLVVTCLSLLSFRNSVGMNVIGFIHGLKYSHVTYVLGSAGMRYNACLLGGVKTTLVLLGIELNQDANRKLTFVCEYAGVLTMTGLLIFSFFRLRSTWRRIAFLTVGVILFYPNSFDYRLIALFVPLAAFFRDEFETERHQAVFCVLFGFLLIPKDYYLIYINASISSILNPLLLFLFLLLLFILSEPAPIQEPV